MTRSDEVGDGTSGVVRIDYTDVVEHAESQGRHIKFEDDHVAQDQALFAAGQQTFDGTYRAADSPAALDGDDNLFADDEGTVRAREPENQESVAASSPLSSLTSEGDEIQVGVRSSVRDEGERERGDDQGDEASAIEEGQEDEEDEDDEPSQDPAARFSREEVDHWRGRFNFRHMGRGRWALGLPTGNVNNMQAVEGPDAEAHRNRHLISRNRR